MDIKVLGIDFGKTVCSLAGLDEAGAVMFRKRLQRHRLLDFLDTLPPCVVAMEACGGAHHIGRFCLQKGHEPRLMSPLYVRPYVKVHKNDDRDAEAIAEAATRPTMSFVAIKSEEQLDFQALHRARERLVSDRTRLINQGRGFLTLRVDGNRIADAPFVQEGRKALATVGCVMLEHRMQADHRNIGCIEPRRDPLRLRQTVQHASGAEHLEHLDGRHLAAEIGERQRMIGVEPVGCVKSGYLAHAISFRRAAASEGRHRYLLVDHARQAQIGRGNVEHVGHA